MNLKIIFMYAKRNGANSLGFVVHFFAFARLRLDCGFNRRRAGVRAAARPTPLAPGRERAAWALRGLLASAASTDAGRGRQAHAFWCAMCQATRCASVAFFGMGCCWCQLAFMVRQQTV